MTLDPTLDEKIERVCALFREGEQALETIRRYARRFFNRSTAMPWSQNNFPPRVRLVLAIVGLAVAGYLVAVHFIVG